MAQVRSPASRSPLGDRRGIRVQSPHLNAHQLLATPTTRAVNSWRDRLRLPSVPPVCYLPSGAATRREKPPGPRSARSRPMRLRIVPWTLVSLAAPVVAQQPRQITADDYARAERALAPNVAPLVSGLAGRPTWLPDGRFWYRASVPNGNAFFVVDPARHTREALFDATRLATALAAATGGGGRVDANRLPFQTFELSKDNRAIDLMVRNRAWHCDLQQYTCAPGDSTSGAAGAPANSSVSPDGQRAVYIKDSNLWMKNLRTGREGPLTTDGMKDFGYATDNAGWVHSDRPIG